MSAQALAAAFRRLPPERRDREVRERLKAPYPPEFAKEALDFNARLVTALREEALWPLDKRGRVRA